MNYSGKKLLILLGLVLGMVGLKGQQLPMSTYQIYRPELINPAYVQQVPLNQIYFAYQHRHLSEVGWRTNSQFFYMKGKPFGKTKGFGWGLYVNNDIEHTERRLSLGGSIGAKLLNTETTFFSAGVNFGLINWGANYGSFRVYDRSDDIIFRPTNFAELDAGLGFAFGINNYYIRSNVNAFAQQIPGSVISSQVRGIRLYPHVYGQANLLFSPAPDIYIGPNVHYRNIYTTDSLVNYVKAAQFDAGLRVDFDRPGFWIAGGWRIDNAAVTAGFGLNISNPDTVDTRSMLATFADLNVFASYPLNEKSVFGPSVEISLKLSLGRVGEDGPQVDTLGLMKGAFWVNNGNMNTHKERRLQANSPDGLFAESIVGEKLVDLRYEFDDNMYMYAGLDFEMFEDSLVERLGSDWVGMDAVMENMVREVIGEALDPTFVGVENPDSVEDLKNLNAVQIGGRLKFDEIAADFGAEGVRYNGEFGTDGTFSDTLTIPFVYDEADTVVKLVKGQLVTNLELAALKTWGMQKRLERELFRIYNSRYKFIYQDDDLPVTDKSIVTILKPIIIPNNPNQKPFMVSTVEIGMVRDPEWEPIVRTGRAAKANAKKKNGRRGQRRDRKRDRDLGRDRVGDDN